MPAQPTSQLPRPSRRRRAMFAALAMAVVSLATALVLLAADVYAHWRTQEAGGVNIWGYRGAPVGKKPPGALRLVLLGGSTAFGWGLPPHESIAAYLEQRLRVHPALQQRQVSVVNLGAPAQGAYGFLYDLQDFAYLDYDAVVMYSGVNDLGSYVARGIDNDYLFRRESPIFRATGYFPVLPIVLRERAGMLTTGGNVSAGYSPDRIRFTPGLPARATAAAMRTFADLGDKVSAQVGRLTGHAPAPAVDADCVPTWKLYCGRVKAAVEWSVAHDKPVLFVSQPYMSDAHVEQQANVSAMLAAAFASTGRVRYVNLGRLIDMTDRSIAYDGVHLVARGNEIVADHMTAPLIELIGGR